jgi:N-acetylneuraminic acid mutarotase
MDDKAKKITEHKVPKRPQFQWKKWRKESPAPVKRCGHVTVADKESNDVKLYLLGGTSNPLYPPVDNEPIPDVWVYSLRNELWTQLSFPTVPVLCYSAALQIDHKLLVVGGWNRGPVNGTFVLDTLRIDQGWKILQTKNPPPARHTHTLTLCDKMIYLFGGIDKAGKRYGDLHELEPIACEWEEIRALNGPVPRSQHSMVACDHYLYIFGGRDGMDRILSDFWCFDTINRKWRQLESPTSTLWYIEGTRLTGPFVIEDRKYLALLHGYSFENIFLFDIKEGKWQSHKCVGDIPSNRGYFTATLMTNHEALIFGGQDDNGTLNDLYSLYLYGVESFPVGATSQPLSQSSHASALATSGIKRVEPPRRLDPPPPASAASDNTPLWIRELIVAVSRKTENDMRTLQTNLMNYMTNEMEKTKKEMQQLIRESLGLVSPLRERPHEETNFFTLSDMMRSLSIEVRNMKQMIGSSESRRQESNQLLKISHQLLKLSQDATATSYSGAPIKSTDLLKLLQGFLRTVVNTKGRELSAVEKQQLTKQLELFPPCYTAVQFDATRTDEQEQVIVMALELLNLSRKRPHFPDMTLMPLFVDLLAAVDSVLEKTRLQE